MKMRRLLLQDDLRPFLERICPLREPGDELMRWLWLMTPANAPTVPLLESTGRNDGPGHVPFLDAFAPREIPAWPHSVRQNAVSEALPIGVHREPGHQRPREGRQRWMLESAYLRDLRGSTTVQIADSLDLFDVQSRITERRSRSADRYIGPGRKTLAELGAWPWCLAEDGKLERRWWTIERYAEALLVWHQNACIDAVEAALISSRGLITPPTWRSTTVTWIVAREMYRTQLSQAVAAADCDAAT